MKLDDSVGQQVAEVQLAPFLDDVGVFAHQQPADVSEEEAPHGVVGVGVRLRILVVDPVVSGPFKDIVLRVPRGKQTFAFFSTVEIKRARGT